MPGFTLFSMVLDKRRNAIVFVDGNSEKQSFSGGFGVLVFRDFGSESFGFTTWRSVLWF